MRTNINLDEKLVDEAFKYAGVTTKKELVNIALQEYIDTHKRKNLAELKGDISFFEDYDYKKMRVRQNDIS
jgi:Arc/MetJ family transcription regulator